MSLRFSRLRFIIYGATSGRSEAHLIQFVRTAYRGNALQTAASVLTFDSKTAGGDALIGTTLCDIWFISMWCCLLQRGELESLLQEFTSEGEEEMKRVLQRMDTLVQVGNTSRPGS